jgi:SAM-dependent methyltransferase
MIGNRLEYERMFEVERTLWWYQVLHEKVLNQLKRHFGKDNKNLRILDAACGTGGLLSFLKDAGYGNLVGFDYSQDAIDFSRQRSLNVGFGDLKNVSAFQPDETFDVICCNDALYFLTDSEIISALTAFKKKLNANGLIIINIHAFEAFSGTHDLAVGSFRRFKLDQFMHYATAAGLNIDRNTYWPFALSLPILAVRQWQNHRIRKQQIDVDQLDSDVKFPGQMINSILKAITKTEQLLIPRAPFGSSLFLVMNSKN